MLVALKLHTSALNSIIPPSELELPSRASLLHQKCQSHIHNLWPYTTKLMDSWFALPLYTERLKQHVIHGNDIKK